jgi:hypothetical protein
VYITDNTRVEARFGWRPTRSVTAIGADLHGWIVENQETLRASLA